MSTAVKKQVTLAEYLAGEEVATFRSEYYRGEVFAMTGGSVRHARIQAVLLRKLGNQLEGKPCQPYAADLRISVKPIGLYTYADLSVICGPPQIDPSDKHGVTNPTVIIEVLSPTTEKYDRTQKFAYYRQLESLQEYMLISSEAPGVEVFSRSEQDGNWEIQYSQQLSDVLHLKSVACQLFMQEIYADLPE